MGLVNLFLKSMLMYFVAYTLIRLNRKGIGEQTSYDYTLLIILGTVAADPLKADGTLNTVVALIGLWTGHLVTVRAARINFLRPLLHGKPIYLVEGGIFDVEKFYASKLTIPELYSELRLAGHSHLAQIQWATLEPSGKLSFIPRSNWQTQVPVPEPLIIDGTVQTRILNMAAKSEVWLREQIVKQGFSSVNQVLIAELVNREELFLVGRK